MNSEQTFELIDRILPFEVCLYHQVLPLSLDEGCLRLGMVNVEDRAALDYLRQLLGHLNCSLALSTISSETHQQILSAYLNQSSQAPAEELSESAAGGEDAREAAVEPQSHPAREAAPKAVGTLERASMPPMPPPSPSNLPPPTLAPLEFHPRYSHSRPEILIVLPPPQLLEELLSRVLERGIGRLHFERQAESGRILWSASGEPQLSLDGIPPGNFQGTINELKKFVGLPIAPVEKSRQAELYRTYNDERVLLRVKIVRGESGEEATLQILRGAALNFYHQQKLADLGHNALVTAQHLQRTLHEMNNRSRLHGKGGKREIVSGLEHVLNQIDRELEALKIVLDS